MSEKFKPRAFMPPYPGIRNDQAIEDWLNDKMPFPDEYLPWIVHAIKFSYRKGGRSAHTYNGYRGELERLILYLAKNKLTPDQVNPLIIRDYMDFCVSPYKSWVMSSKAHRFDRYGRCNPDWRPFYIPKQKDAESKAKVVSAASIQRRFSFLKQWFEDLLEEGFISRNPVKQAITESPHVSRSTEEVIPISFSKREWKIVFNALIEMADENQRWERALFVILLMKTCYLRISDLCARSYFEPVMSHFYCHEGYWFLRVMSKGRKTRSVTVPNAFLAFLDRYRNTRALHGLPTPDEKEPLVAKDKGRGGVGSRQMDRIIRDAFNEIANKLESTDAYLSKKVRGSVTHVLRHTGASIDAFWRPLPELAEELGHVDPGTTGRIYVHSGRRERAEEGSKRALS